MRTDISPLYDWFSNRPNPESKDYHDVIAWLAAHGVSLPAVSYLPPSGVAPSVIPEVMYLTFAEYPKQPMDAALVLNEPTSVLVMVGKDPVRYSPPKPPEPPPDAGDGNPVGAFSYTDEYGKRHYFADPRYFPSAPDILPDPQGGQLKKRFRPGPFGAGWMEWVSV